MPVVKLWGEMNGGGGLNQSVTVVGRARCCVCGWGGLGIVKAGVLGGGGMAGCCLIEG